MASKKKKLSAAELKALLEAIASGRGREVSPELQYLFQQEVSPERFMIRAALEESSEAARLRREEEREKELDLEFRPPIRAVMEQKERQAEDARLPSMLIPNDPKEAEKIQAALRRLQYARPSARTFTSEGGQTIVKGGVPMVTQTVRIERVSAGRSKRAAFSDAAQKRIIRRVKEFLEDRGIDVKEMLSDKEKPFLDDILANPGRLLARLRVERLPDGTKRFLPPENEGERKIKAVYDKIQEALSIAEVTPRVTSRRTGPKKGRVEYSREGGSIALTPMKNAKGETVFALPDLPPIAFSQIYARNRPRRDSFNPTINDPAVQSRIKEAKEKLGPPPPETDQKARRKYFSNLARIQREAIEEVGDLQHKIAGAQWDAVRELIRQDPVFFDVQTDEDRKALESMPKRHDYDPGESGYRKHQAALQKWYESERARRGGGTDFYVCSHCPKSVRTGHTCSCRLNNRLKLPGQRKFKAFVPPKIRDEDYERDDRYEVLTDRNGEPVLKVSYQVRLKSARDRYAREKAAFEESEKSNFMQQLRRMPAEKRLYEQISREISKKLGKRPTDPEAARAWDLRKMQLAGEELIARIGDMQSASLDPRAGPESAGAGAMRGPAMLRSLEDVAAPGTVIVRADSKAEAEAKATDVVQRAGFKPKYKKEIEVVRKKKLDGLGIAWSEDIGGTATTVAVGGLVVYALFKALTSKR